MPIRRKVTEQAVRAGSHRQMHLPDSPRRWAGLGEETSAEVRTRLPPVPRASCFWDESGRDSRIGEILIQPAGWAEASRRWQSRIRKTCAIG